MQKNKNKLIQFKLVDTSTGPKFYPNSKTQYYLLRTQKNAPFPENSIERNNIITKITQRIYLTIATQILMETTEHYRSFFKDIQNSLAHTQILLNESFKNDEQISKQPMLLDFIENHAMTLERTKQLFKQFTIDKSALFTISKKNPVRSIQELNRYKNFLNKSFTFNAQYDPDNIFNSVYGIVKNLMMVNNKIEIIQMCHDTNEKILALMKVLKKIENLLLINEYTIKRAEYEEIEDYLPHKILITGWDVVPVDIPRDSTLINLPNLPFCVLSEDLVLDKEFYLREEISNEEYLCLIYSIEHSGRDLTDAAWDEYKKIVLKSELNIPPIKVLEKFSKEITSGLGWWRMVIRLFDTPDDTILANKYRLCDTVLNLLSEATSKGLKCSVDQPEKALSLIQILQEDSTCQEDIFNDSNYFSGGISQPQSKR
jgi:hypothetical protein